MVASQRKTARRPSLKMSWLWSGKPNALLPNTGRFKYRSKAAKGHSTVTFVRKETVKKNETNFADLGGHKSSEGLGTTVKLSAHLPVPSNLWRGLVRTIRPGKFLMCAPSGICLRQTEFSIHSQIGHYRRPWTFDITLTTSFCISMAAVRPASRTSSWFALPSCSIESSSFTSLA